MKNKVIIFLGLILMFVLNCGEKHEAVKNFETVMNTLQNGDIDRASKDKDLKISPETIKVYSEAYKNMTYKINKTTVKDDNVIINITMKTPDFKGLVIEYIEKLNSSADQMKKKNEEERKLEEEKLMTSLVKARISDPNLKYLEKTFDVLYKKSDSNWVMDQVANKDFIEMITFGMLKVNS